VGRNSDSNGRRLVVQAFIAPAMLAGLTACTIGAKFPDLGASPSPRVASGRDIPKGGGVYKVGQPYQISGRRYVPAENPAYDRRGVASWYGEAFHGRRTANGEVYNMYALTAGHPTLPLPSYAYVTNLENGRTLLVRINDRGPYVDNRLIDLSYATARALGYQKQGLARVRVRYAGRAPLNGDDSAERAFAAKQPWAGTGAYASLGASSMTTASLGSREAPAAQRTWSVWSHREALKQGGAVQHSGPAAVTAKTETTADIYLVVGPFAERTEAERVRYMLAGGEPSMLVPSPSDTEEYQVRLGPYTDNAATSAMARIAASGFDPHPTPTQ